MPEDPNQPGAPSATNDQSFDFSPMPGAEAANDAGEAARLAAQLSELQNQLSETQNKLSETQDAFLRAKAETENTRKRAQLDLGNAHKFAVESFSSALLAVKDSLEAALATNNATAESMKSGVELTLRQLTQVFEKFNLSEVNPLGEKFDPHRHQAISMVEAEQPANTVVTVLQKGYLLAERVLRPALVMVSKGSANADQGAGQDNATT